MNFDITPGTGRDLMGLFELGWPNINMRDGDGWAVFTYSIAEGRYLSPFEYEGGFLDRDLNAR